MNVRIKVKVRPLSRTLNAHQGFSENGIYDVIDMQPMDRYFHWCIVGDDGVPVYVAANQLIVEEVIYDNDSKDNSTNNAVEDGKISPAIKMELSKLRNEIKALKNG